jgi:5-methylcytosine-specific restriction endonuclease McrA
MKCKDCANEAVPGRVLCPACADKNAVRCKKYRQNNLEDRKEKDRLYNLANRDKRTAYARQYRKDNPEKCAAFDRNKDPEKRRQYNKQYQENNREKLRAYNQLKHIRNYAQNRLEINARNRLWFQKNREKSCDKTARYRAKKNRVFVEKVSKLEILERDGYICQICGGGVLPFVGVYHPLYPNIDHIIPIARGGLHTASNLQTTHRGCNTSKGTKDTANPAYIQYITSEVTL